MASRRIHIGPPVGTTNIGKDRSILRICPPTDGWNSMPAICRRWRSLTHSIACPRNAPSSVNFGVLSLTFADPQDRERIDQDDELVIEHLHDALQKGTELTVVNRSKKRQYRVDHSMTGRQVHMVHAGSLINIMRRKSTSSG